MVVVVAAPWSVFADRVARARGEWVTYQVQLKNPRSAQTTASMMRKRFPHFEIKTSRGVITARLREVR